MELERIDERTYTCSLDQQPWEVSMSRLESHVATVQRRMTYAILVDWLAVCAFVLAGGALLLIGAQRLIHCDIPVNALWIGAGLGAVVAFTMPLINRPSRKSAAVA